MVLIHYKIPYKSSFYLNIVQLVKSQLWCNCHDINTLPEQ